MTFQVQGQLYHYPTQVAVRHASVYVIFHKIFWKRRDKLRRVQEL